MELPLRRLRARGAWDVKLPNRERAVIEPAKLTGYLLSLSHPVGRFKAAFFRSLGYDAVVWQKLEHDLRSQHLELEAAPIQGSSFGQKYEIRGPLVGPAGRCEVLVSVWIIRDGEEIPRLVTAYPGGGRS